MVIWGKMDRKNGKLCVHNTAICDGLVTFGL